MQVLRPAPDPWPWAAITICPHCTAELRVVFDDLHWIDQPHHNLIRYNCPECSRWSGIGGIPEYINTAVSNRADRQIR